MVLFPQTVLGILARGASVRIPAKGVFPQTMLEYASAARASGGTVIFVVGDSVLFPQTLNEVSAVGGNHVQFDFADLAE